MANPKSDAFLQLHREIASFRGESAFSTWLHRLAVNVILMHLCKKGPPQISHEETLEPTEEGGPEKEYGFEDQVLAGSSDRLVLERAIENLPPGYRIFFVLHDVEGYEHNQIAEMLGCSVGYSKSQLYKARVTVRDVLRITRAVDAPKKKINIQRPLASDIKTAMDIEKTITEIEWLEQLVKLPDKRPLEKTDWQTANGSIVRSTPTIHGFGCGSGITDKLRYRIAFVFGKSSPRASG